MQITKLQEDAAQQFQDIIGDFTNRLYDEIADRRGAEEDYYDDLANLAEDHADELVDFDRDRERDHADFLQDQAEDERDHYRDLENLARDHQRELADIESGRGRTIQDINEEYRRDVADLNTDFQRDYQRVLRNQTDDTGKTNQQLRELRIKYNQQLSDLDTDYQRDRIDLDIDYARDVEDLETDTARDKADRIDDFLTEQKDALDQEEQDLARSLIDRAILEEAHKNERIRLAEEAADEQKSIYTSLIDHYVGELERYIAELLITKGVELTLGQFGGEDGFNLGDLGDLFSRDGDSAVDGVAQAAGVVQGDNAQAGGGGNEFLGQARDAAIVAAGVKIVGDALRDNVFGGQQGEDVTLEVINDPEGVTARALRGEDVRPGVGPDFRDIEEEEEQAAAPAAVRFDESESEQRSGIAGFIDLAIASAKAEIDAQRSTQADDESDTSQPDQRSGIAGFIDLAIASARAEIDAQRSAQENENNTSDFLDNIGESDTAAAEAVEEYVPPIVDTIKDLGIDLDDNFEDLNINFDRLSSILQQDTATLQRILESEPPSSPLADFLDDQQGLLRVLSAERFADAVEEFLLGNREFLELWGELFDNIALDRLEEDEAAYLRELEETLLAAGFSKEDIDPLLDDIQRAFELETIDLDERSRLLNRLGDLFDEGEVDDVTAGNFLSRLRDLLDNVTVDLTEGEFITLKDGEEVPLEAGATITLASGETILLEPEQQL